MAFTSAASLATPKPARPRSRRSGFAVLVALFWLSLLALPNYAWGVTLDESWEQGLGILLERGAQAGTDYVFTYGPLGYFLTTAYAPGLFWAKLAWEAALKLAMAFTFASVLRRLRGTGLKLAFAAVIVAFLGPEDRSVRDATFVMFLLCLTLLAFDRPVRSRWGFTYVLALALLAQVKLTLLILAAFYLAVRTAALAWSQGWGEALAGPALFVGAWLAIWVAARQSLANLPAYVAGSWQIASGFTEAMALDTPERVHEVWLALASLAALAAMWLTLSPRRRRQPRAVALAVAVAGTIFFQWKEGFTRHDGLHARVFFVSVLAVMFAALARLRPAGPARAAKILGGAVVGCCVLGISSSTYPPYEFGRLTARNLSGPFRHALQILTPLRLRNDLEARRAAVPAEWRLPRIRAAVGDAPVDLFTNIQGYLFANGLSWRPRPIFQSYTAYTPVLRQANADFVRSPSAPEYLLMAPTAIDRRLPSSEDGPALLAVLRRYRPLLIENGFLLLRRDDNVPGPAPTPGPVRLARTARLGETVSLAGVSDAYQTLSVAVRPSLAGRLLAFAYRPEPLALVVTTAAGPQRRYRLVPGTAQDVLINPLLADGFDLRDLLHLYGLPGAPRALSLSVTGFEGVPFGYESEVQLTVRACPPPPFPPLAEADVGRLLGP